LCDAGEHPGDIDRTQMRRGWNDIEARSHENDAWAERLENRLHTIALVITTIVLAMRLVAGTRDLADGSDFEDQPAEMPAAEAQSAAFL
jgi:hypothetical protein